MSIGTSDAPVLKQIQDFIEACNGDGYVHKTSELGSIPVSLYTDDARLSAEQANIFNKAPVIIGHVSQLPRKGDHFTFDHLGQSLLVVRGSDGKIRVFYNICRHRGVRLVSAEGVGRKPSFVCPYHNWTYGLEGQLAHIPCLETFKNDDVKGRHLVEVSSAVSGGFIFVSLDPDHPMNMDGFLGELSEDFDALGLPDQAFFKQSVRKTKSNWKLIVEAFQDGYHVVRLHRNSVGPLFMDNVADTMRIKQHIRALVARNGFAQMCHDAPKDWDVRNQLSIAYFVYPNTIIIIHPDYISQLGLFPVSTDETICVHSCFLDEEPKSDKARAHFDRAFDIIDKEVFTAEDFFVCEQAQLGMKSGVNKSFPLSQHEVGLKIFHEIINEQVGDWPAI